MASVSTRFFSVSNPPFSDDSTYDPVSDPNQTRPDQTLSIPEIIAKYTDGEYIDPSFFNGAKRLEGDDDLEPWEDPDTPWNDDLASNPLMSPFRRDWAEISQLVRNVNAYVESRAAPKSPVTPPPPPTVVVPEVSPPVDPEDVPPDSVA